MSPIDVKNFSSLPAREFTRRGALRTMAGAWLAAPLGLSVRSEEVASAADHLAGAATARELADQEEYWGLIQAAFPLDRTAIYLNTGGIGPTPTLVQAALRSNGDHAARLPSRHTWTDLEPAVESVRASIALTFGVDENEIALTRGATEALEIVQLGLTLKAGDEVLTTDQDFFRMLNTWGQRVQRDGIVLRTISYPTPAPSPEELVERFERAITPRTRVLLLCHVTNTSGDILPVRRICRMARERGVLTIVDGAQAFGHFPTTWSDLECDIYGTSLHKFAMGPLGSGFLFIRKDLIPDLWPLFPTRPGREGDIRKFEDVGTHPAGTHNAVAEALAFHEAIGSDRIGERLRYLTRRWAERAADLPGVSLRTSLERERSCGIATVSLSGQDPRDVVRELWDDAHVVVRAVRHADCYGVRVSPHVHTRVAELDRFSSALQRIALKRRT